MAANDEKGKKPLAVFTSDTLSTHELMIRWRIELERAPCVENFTIDETGKGIEVNFRENYHCDKCPNEWCFKKGEWVEGCGAEQDKLPGEAEPPASQNNEDMRMYG